MTIEVVGTEYGFEISWDPNDPIDSVLSDWTEEQFIEILMSAANRVLARHDIKEEHNFEEGILAK